MSRAFAPASNNRPAFDEVGDQDSIHKEAGAVVDEQGQLADLLHKLDRAPDGSRVGGRRANHFNQLHSVHWIEEMDADDAFGMSGAGGKFRNRQRRGIGCQNRMVTRRGFQFAENLLLRAPCLRRRLQ